jgi:hypothetical protein
MSEGRRHRDVVMPVRVDPTGLAGPTPGQARGWRWRRVSKGLYVPADVDPTTTAQRIVEAVAGTGGAVTGWAAVHWMGATWFDGVASGGPLPVPIALGDRRQVRPRPGVSVSEDWLFHDDVFVVDELPVTVPERSVTFQVRRTRSLARAVQIIDMAAFDDLVDIVGLTAYADRLVARGGVRLFDLSGRHLFTPDLLDPVRGVAGEYNGAVHDGVAPRRRDLDREELYRKHGIEALWMMSPDNRDVSRFVGRLHASYRRAADRRPGDRTWTLVPPHWWVDTSTVARRRALSPDLRARWLRRQQRTSYLT